MHADCGPSSAAPRAEAAGAPSPFRALLRRGAGAVPRPVVVSAPMAEITDAAYRVMAFEAGADACWTEMVSAAGLTHGSAASPLLLLPLPEERGRPLVAQLYGSNPAEMAEAVRIVSDLGIFDAIDLNAGCPAPKVVRTGGGAALLRNLPLYGALIAAAVRATSLPVTVKTRIGAVPAAPLAAELARIAEDAGAALLSMHGRYAAAFHSGPVHADALASAVQAVRIPVLVNGGIDSSAVALDLLAKTGAAGVMLGRAAVGNPWLFGAVRSALAVPGDAAAAANAATSAQRPGSEVRAALLRHLALSLEAKTLAHVADPDRAAATDFRRSLFLYFRGRPGAARLRGRLNTLTGVAEIRAAIDAFFTAEAAAAEAAAPPDAVRDR